MINTTGDKQNASSAYLDGTASVFNEAPADTQSSSAATAPTHTTDMPPDYSTVEIQNGFQNTTLSPTVSSAETYPASLTRNENSYSTLTVATNKPKEIHATKGFDFTRSLVISATNLSKSSMTVEPDIDINNNDTIIVIAKVTSSKTNLSDKCNVTWQVNQQGAYELNVNSGWSMWSMASVECQFTLRLPPNIIRTHPGLRADLSGGRVDMEHLGNITFDHVAIKSNNSAVSLLEVNGGIVQVTTTNAKICLKNVVAQNAMDIKTVNGPISVSESRAKRMGIKTTNGPVDLQATSAQVIQVETTNAKIISNKVVAAEARFTTTNRTIKASNNNIDSLHISTTDAKIEGTWIVGCNLDIKTTDSRIDGFILFKQPTARANIRLATTDSRIKVRLPAAEFRGTFDAKTTSRTVNIKWKNAQDVQKPAIRQIVEEKSYKRGVIGEPHESQQHELLAQTSDSGIEIVFV
ncbi:hypothetical protein GGI07_001838 [Coemansia sp. Benny D115]|nr:hypothetical protein GGI07_001838 [Coemansia sp. Benny D115]